MRVGKFNELGIWSNYFLIKITLFLLGKMEFHFLGNLLLALLLLLHLQGRPARVLRQICAIGIAIVLLYVDAKIPLNAVALALINLPEYEWWYSLDVVLRLLSLQVVLIIALLCIVNFYISQYLEIGVIVFVGFLAMALLKSGIATPLFATNYSIASNVSASHGASAVPLPNSDQALNSYLQKFFQSEQSRTIEMTNTSQAMAPFDIVFISICSLAWDDIALVGMNDHPMFNNFDIVFEKFNSASSYSGPAVTRLLRASCGQSPHEKLSVRDGVDHCLVFQQLKHLGYEQALLMNHDGRFDGFLNQLKVYGGIDASLASQVDIPVCQKAFDGSPVLCDRAVLDQWLKARNTSSVESQAVFFNTVSLHDGNRVVGENRLTGLASYTRRLRILLDDLQGFIDNLTQSDRNTLLILIPEHGAALRGDKMQLTGIREIPSPSITHIPVAIKFIGPRLKRVGGQVSVAADSSFLAISALIANVMQQNIFASNTFSPQSVVDGLPSTAAVSQNEGSAVIHFGSSDYVTVDGKSWSRY
ncbi:MAG: cellulose biosynthesis protein BcsG [Zhongshania sp.]|uniref:cellulose biosynthesis protein BcsG n=1 Tax=Zhongshania sp. TaxID=1971902 RepID=UPI0026028949|nr:cellulose biosynthesis protein BcsG [Zhongshania sp.]MDF1693790.1 cellulose biosynthesis protein BcsG [Zhongshania sp.]